jgi:hypothetical protein
MSEQIFKIVYCSRNLIAGDDQARTAEIEHILESARRNNSKAGVTGALLYSSGFFAQALEGPRGEIEVIFERIQRDPRHGDVTVLESDYEPKRNFSAWTMAYVETSAGTETDTVGAILQNVMADKAEAGRVVELLCDLVLQED